MPHSECDRGQDRQILAELAMQSGSCPAHECVVHASGSSRISDDAWIISIAAAASRFSGLHPADSPTAIVSTPRTRLPEDVSARFKGSASGFGATARRAMFRSVSSISARRAAK